MCCSVFVRLLLALVKGTPAITLTHTLILTHTLTRTGYQRGRDGTYALPTMDQICVSVLLRCISNPFFASY
jgi:hypothetical protein